MHNGRGYGGGGGKGWGMGKGMGRGGGRGQGMSQGRGGGGRGVGRCRDMASPAGAQTPAPQPREDARQAQVLEAEAQDMASQLRAITNRIAELEATGVDVLAPRAPAAATGYQPQKRLARMTARIDEEKCTCCGLCIDICPNQAIGMNHAVTIDSSKCTGCGSCVNECRNEAISMCYVTQSAAS